MHSLKRKDDKRHYSKKDKQLMKLILPNAGSEDEGSEHELSYYLNDRVKMMKEILKIIKPRKIKNMAPDCMKSMDIEEINSMLLEELLGISNKRLRYIFNGQNLNEESSSTDPEDQSVDIISLDDISDDDLIIDLDSDGDSKKKAKKHKTNIKQEPKRKKFKKEKHDKIKDTKSKKEESNGKENPMSEKNLMSVLELLELQARARAIRSQIVLESQKPPEPEKPKEDIEDDNDEDAVIVESPKNVEIVITSSESENEQAAEENSKESESEMEKNAVSKNKIRVIQQTTINNGAGTSNSFWKNSEKDNNVASNITENNTDEHDAHINQQTLPERADLENSQDLVDEAISDTKNSEKEQVAEIPLPESESTVADNKVDTPTTVNEVDNQNKNEKKENPEEKEQTIIESKEKVQVVKHRSKKDHKCRKLVPEEIEEKEIFSKKEDNETNVSSTEQTKIDKDDDTKKNKKDSSKRVCKRKKLIEEQKVNMDKSILNNEESIVLNVDQHDIDCIYLD